ncbi:hypothetical protein ACOSQ3_027600 [Xanthoceras sorbifolium]
MVRNIRRVANTYLLGRWRKDVYRHHSKISVGLGIAQMNANMVRVRELETKFFKIVDYAYSDITKLDFVNNCIDECKNALKQWRGVEGDNPVLNVDGRSRRHTIVPRIRRQNNHVN